MVSVSPLYSCYSMPVSHLDSGMLVAFLLLWPRQFIEERVYLGLGFQRVGVHDGKAEVPDMVGTAN